MGEHNIKRGLKWVKAIELATLQHREKDVEWFKSNPSVQTDIKEYEDSISKPIVEAKKPSKKA